MIIFGVNGGIAINVNVIAAMASDGYVHLPSDSFHRFTLIGWTPATGSNIVYPMDYSITDATPTIVMQAVSQFNYALHHQLPGQFHSVH